MPSNYVVVHLFVPRPLRARLKALAARREISLRQLAVEAFEAVLTRGEARNAEPPSAARPSSDATRGARG